MLARLMSASGLLVDEGLLWFWIGNHSEYERIINAMKTGMTMTVTTLAALSVTYFVAESAVLKEIMVIIIIGLLIDVVNTWLQNASILRYYLERKVKKED